MSARLLWVLEMMVFCGRPNSQAYMFFLLLIQFYSHIMSSGDVLYIIVSQCGISCKAFYCLPRLELHLGEHLLKTTWGTQITVDY